MQSYPAAREGAPGSGSGNGPPTSREVGRNSGCGSRYACLTSSDVVQYPGNAPEPLGAQSRARSRAVLRLLLGRLGRFCSRLFGVTVTRLPRTFGYARISPVDEDGEAQIEALEQAGAEQVFVDRVQVKGARPELERCRQQLRSGDTLLVWSIARLGQSLGHLMRLVEELRARGVELRSASENLENFGEAMEVLILCDRSMRSERSLVASQEHGTKAGRWGGRSLFHDPGRLAEARRLLSENKMSRAEVAERLGVSQSTLSRWFPVKWKEKRGPGRPRKNAAKAAEVEGGML